MLVRPYHTTVSKQSKWIVSVSDISAVNFIGIKRSVSLILRRKLRCAVYLCPFSFPEPVVSWSLGLETTGSLQIKYKPRGSGTKITYAPQGKNVISYVALKLYAENAQKAGV